MRATVTSSIDPNRNRLAEVLPLDAPYTIYIEPTRYCNLKCFYCMHGTRGRQGGALEQMGFRLINMEETLYGKIVDDIMKFPVQPKRIVFSGLGEPLMNPELPHMLHMLRKEGYEGRLDVITNGVLLSHQMADELIESGISRMQISIQGITQEHYAENCGVPVKIDQLCENIRYFYEKKEDAQVYVKIIDAELRNQDEENLFYELFGDICDSIYIEHLIVLEQQMGDHGGRVDHSRNLSNEEIKEWKCCAVPTYHLQIGVEGDVFPCPVVGLPIGFAMGNVKDSSLSDIWKSEKRKQFILSHLKGKKEQLPVCKTCSTHVCVQDERENLEKDAEILIKKYSDI